MDLTNLDNHLDHLRVWMGEHPVQFCINVLSLIVAWLVWNIIMSVGGENNDSKSQSDNNEGA